RRCLYGEPAARGPGLQVAALEAIAEHRGCRRGGHRHRGAAWRLVTGAVDRADGVAVCATGGDGIGKRRDVADRLVQVSVAIDPITGDTRGVIGRLPVEIDLDRTCRIAGQP